MDEQIKLKLLAKFRTDAQVGKRQAGSKTAEER